MGAFFIGLLPFVKSNAIACALVGALLFYTHETFISKAQAQETFSKRFLDYERKLADIKSQITIDKYEQQIFSLNRELARYESLLEHGDNNPMYISRITDIKSELDKVKRKLKRISYEDD